MSMVTIHNFIICSLATLASADLGGQGFLAKGPKVHTDAIQNELMGVLSEVLGHGHDVTEDRLKHINATLVPIFRSLPKNNRGHVSEPIMRYAMRRYFSATHAWMVKGFEEHGDYSFNATSSDAHIFQSKVPDFVQSVMKQKFAHQGFSLHDMQLMIAVLESLAFNEVVRAVELSFHLNSFGTGAILSEAQVKEVLASFLMTEMLGATTDAEQHKEHKSNPHDIYPNWEDGMAFLTDISGSDVFGRHGMSNPFTVKTSAFEDVVRMAGRIMQEFGPWSSYECHDMKNVLAKFDVHETGRVKISDFYKASKDGAWQFLEPSEYLRQLGALDESSEYLGPQVIIQNYMTGMSNCITSTQYFSICCLNECDLIYQHIESDIPYTHGTVSQILESVESLPTLPVISQQMTNKLEEIATINGGSIPLHGRLLAQWLHFVVPHECPYPHAVGSITPKIPDNWRIAVGDEFEAVGEDEMKQHFEHVTSSRDPSPDAGKGMWDLQESIMDWSTPSDTDDAMFSKVLQVSSQVVIIGSFAALAVREGIKRFRTSKGYAKGKEYTI